ncbi:MAG: hypothetical protein ACRDP7_25690 [Trebonia sp.]
MTSADDPFERAAHREHVDRLHREAMITGVRDSFGERGGKDVLTAIVVFLGPYLLWAALRAANHAWSTPTVGKSVVNFFFGSGIPFAIYTAWMLLLIWIWAITLASQDRKP